MQPQGTLLIIHNTATRDVAHNTATRVVAHNMQPQGTLLIIQPQGSLLIIQPQGTLLIIQPQGTLLIIQPQGTLLIIQPQGSLLIISDVPIRCTVRCTVIRYGTKIRRTTVFIRFWTINTVKYGTAYGTVQTSKASVKKLKLSFVSALQTAK
jgi:hypothetical protein